MSSTDEYVELCKINRKLTKIIQLLEQLLPKETLIVEGDKVAPKYRPRVRLGTEYDNI